MEYSNAISQRSQSPSLASRFLPVVTLLALLGLEPAMAREITIYLDVGSAPTMYESTRGESVGIYPEILRRAFAKMQVPARIQPRPFRRLITELNAGSAGAGAFIRTPERDAYNDFSAPYFIEHVAVYHRGEQVPFATLADLKGKRVGVIAGWSYGEAFDRAAAAGEFIVDHVERDIQNFEKLLRDRVDYVLATELAGKLWLKTRPNTDVAAGKSYLISADICLAFNKRAKQKELLAKFDQTMRSLQKNGDIGQIVLQELERGSLAFKAASNGDVAAARR